VYYTPTYIVEYIVEKTIGKLLEGKRPGPRGGASRLRIVDPACGSGSFLIGAYQYLLDWHRDRYVEDGTAKWKDRLYEGRGGQYHLTIDEKKRILLNNIHGVDIDPQAVEVTKLSLLLKVLEGESEASLATQLRMFQERALPDLDENIKCGNSLIGSDFYDDPQMALLDEEEHYRVNVFDWKRSFPQLFKGDNPGFDAVIGNPPYLRIQGLQEYYGPQIEYFLRRYQSAVKRFDLYLLFAEKGFSLLRKDALLGFICPHKFLNSDFGSGLRDYLIRNAAMESFISFGNNLVFNQASTYTGILLLRKGAEVVSVKFCKLVGY
jgi:type I restriction-modification system DNA methylase subunit